LLAGGKPASLPVAVVENASLPESRTIYTTLGLLPALAAEQLQGPAVMLLGEQFVATSTASVETIAARVLPALRKAAG